MDTGSPDCLFHAGICRSIGIRNVENGIKTTLGGILSGPRAEVYFHKVAVRIAGEQFEVTAGFSWEFSVAGILGRRGFFENFVVTIDATPSTPILDIQRIRRQ